MTIEAVAPLYTADALGFPVTGGTFSIQQAITKNGLSAVRFNESSSTGHVYFNKQAADGSPAMINTASQRWFGGWLYLNSLPSVKSDIGYWGDSVGGVNSRLHVDTSGNLILNGTADSATIATLATGTWYWVEHRATPGGTCAARVNGGTEQTVTAKNSNNLYWYRLGNIFTSCTFDFVWDGCVIDDAAYPGPCAVQVQIPDGDQTTDWTGGTGTGHGEVDEVDGSHANDGDTTYVQSAHSGDVARYSLSNISGTAPIKAIVGFMICRDEGGVSSVLMSMKINGFATTAMDPGSSYVYRAIIANTDPSTGVAWTASGSNGNTIRAVMNASVAIRVTAMGAFVICQLQHSGAGASTLPKLSSTATGTLISAMTGTGASTVPKLTSAGVAKEILKAVGASTIPKLTSAASAVEKLLGAATSILPKLLSAGTGGTGTIHSGAGASTMPKLTSLAAGLERLVATAGSTLPKLTSAASGHLPSFATAASTLPRLSSLGSGAVKLLGTAASTLPKLTSAAVGRFPLRGAGASSLPKLLSAAFGAVPPRGAGASTLPKLRSGAAGTVQQAFRVLQPGVGRVWRSAAGVGRVVRDVRHGIGRSNRPGPGVGR